MVFSFKHIVILPDPPGGILRARGSLLLVLFRPAHTFSNWQRYIYRYLLFFGDFLPWGIAKTILRSQAERRTICRHFRNRRRYLFDCINYPFDLIVSGASNIYDRF